MTGYGKLEKFPFSSDLQSNLILLGSQENSINLRMLDRLKFLFYCCNGRFVTFQYFLQHATRSTVLLAVDTIQDYH